MPASARRRVGVGLCATALLAPAASGCGDERRDFREEQLRPLVVRVGEQRATLAATLRSVRSGRPRDAAVLRAQVAQLRATMRRIAALDPPEGTETRFRRYTRANARLLATLSRFVEALAAGSASAQRRAAAQVSAAVADVERTQTAFQRSLQ